MRRFGSPSPAGIREIGIVRRDSAAGPRTLPAIQRLLDRDDMGEADHGVGGLESGPHLLPNAFALVLGQLLDRLGEWPGRTYFQPAWARVWLSHGGGWSNASDL